MHDKLEVVRDGGIPKTSHEHTIYIHMCTPPSYSQSLFVGTKKMGKEKGAERSAKTFLRPSHDDDDDNDDHDDDDDDT